MIMDNDKEAKTKRKLAKVYCVTAQLIQPSELNNRRVLGSSIGGAFFNADGSVDIQLESLPINGRMFIESVEGESK